MSTSTPGTYSVPISGPSAALAFLRALALKAQTVAAAAWAKTTLILGTALRLPTAVAAGVQAVLSTSIGYRTTTSLARRITRTIWSGIRAAARLTGRIGRGVGNTTTIAIGYVSPSGADWMVRACDTIGDRANGWAQRIDTTITTAGQVAWDLLHTTLVRRTVTLTSTIASALVTIHWMSRGVVAARIVRAMPFLMDTVIVATNPLRTLLVVAAAATVAMGIALTRLLSATRRDHAATPAGQEARVPESVTLPPNWQDIAARLRIEVTSDGSVTTHGIPDDIPRPQGELIARIATDAAIRQFTRTRKTRPYPSRDDKRLFTKVAQEALHAAGRRQFSPDQHAA